MFLSSRLRDVAESARARERARTRTHARIPLPPHTHAPCTRARARAHNRPRDFRDSARRVTHRSQRAHVLETVADRYRDSRQRAKSEKTRDWTTPIDDNNKYGVRRDHLLRAPCCDCRRSVRWRRARRSPLLLLRFVDRPPSAISVSRWRIDARLRLLLNYLLEMNVIKHYFFI